MVTAKRFRDANDQNPCRRRNSVQFSRFLRDSQNGSKIPKGTPLGYGIPWDSMAFHDPQGGGVRIVSEFDPDRILLGGVGNPLYSPWMPRDPYWGQRKEFYNIISPRKGRGRGYRNQHLRVRRPWNPCEGRRKPGIPLDIHMPVFSNKQWILTYPHGPP